MARAADPNLKASVLSAAREVFREKGYADARMSDIAARAGVAVGSIYLHFKTKEALVAALADEMNREVLAWLAPCLDLPDAIDAMEAVMRAGLAYLEQERDLIKLLYLSAGLSEMAGVWDDQQDPITHMMADFFRRRMAAGEIRRYDPEKLAVLIFGMVDQAAMHTLLTGTGDISDYTSTLVQMVRNLLKPDSTPARKTPAAKPSSKKRPKRAPRR